MLSDFLDEAGHFLIYMLRKFIEANCTCGSQSNSIHDHDDRCSVKYEAARYLAHQVEVAKAKNAPKVAPVVNPQTNPIAALPASVTGKAPAPRLVPQAASPFANLPPILPPPDDKPLPPHDANDTASIIAALRGKSPAELAEIAKAVQDK